MQFKQYHQSDVRIKSRLKGVDISEESFWANASTAELDGRKAVVKRYEVGLDEKDRTTKVRSPSRRETDFLLTVYGKRWLHDLKMLKSL